jgi:hypothetical protein
MASRGARALLLLSRKGAVSEDSIQILIELRAQGVQVEAPVCDVSDMNELYAMLQTYSHSMPPIKGCIQASMSLEVFLAPKHVIRHL